ncbi:MAG TPA: J domain-containing protein, partial [Fibrobacteria bacterium]|nr:J domain-containing protein [Fibrobacteria bacterium]
MNKDLRNIPTRAVLPSPGAGSNADDLPTRLTRTMDRLAELEAEAQLLERELPPLQAKLFAAQEAIVKEVVETRKSLVLLVRRLVESSPRRGVLRREGPDLIWHIARDLDERFGVDVRGLLPDLPSPDEDEDDGDDCSWASGGSHRDSGQPPHDAPGNPPKPRRTTLDPQDAAKGIYRSLARELHPDKTRDEEERQRRTELMQRITRAWQDRDLGALLKLLAAHGSEDARAQAMDEATLQACLQGVEQTLAELQRRVKNLRH